MPMSTGLGAFVSSCVAASGKDTPGVPQFMSRDEAVVSLHKNEVRQLFTSRVEFSECPSR